MFLLPFAVAAAACRFSIQLSRKAMAIPRNSCSATRGPSGDTLPYLKQDYGTGLPGQQPAAAELGDERFGKVGEDRGDGLFHSFHNGANDSQKSYLTRSETKAKLPPS
jgi:hypothetical protein